MRKMILICAFGASIFSVLANEQAECDGKAHWQKNNMSSGDVLLRKCDVFGRTFIEIKVELHEDRCITIKNAKNGQIWKNFYLQEDEVKSMSFTGRKVPAHIKVVSNQTINYSCKR
jgi:hypothetical protein